MLSMKSRPAVRRKLLLFLLLSSEVTVAMAKTSLLYIATQNPEKMGIAVAEFDSGDRRTFGAEAGHRDARPGALHAVR